MAKWLNNGIGDGGTTRTCSSCHISQTVNIYGEKVQFKYCPYCGARMEDVDLSEPMSSKELHIKRIVPLRQEVQAYEREYEKRYRKEKAVEAGLKSANCDNCAYSCVLEISDHNGCLGGRCTCCNDFCYKWMPDTPVSAWLRQNKHYDEYLVYKLQNVFGDDFLKSADVELVKRGLEWMKEVEDEGKKK